MQIDGSSCGLAEIHLFTDRAADGMGEDGYCTSQPDLTRIIYMNSYSANMKISTITKKSNDEATQC